MGSCALPLHSNINLLYIPIVYRANSTSFKIAVHMNNMHHMHSATLTSLSKFPELMRWYDYRFSAGLFALTLNILTICHQFSFRQSLYFFSILFIIYITKLSHYHHITCTLILLAYYYLLICLLFSYPYIHSILSFSLSLTPVTEIVN